MKKTAAAAAKFSEAQIILHCVRRTQVFRLQKFAGKWESVKLHTTTGTAAADRKKYAGLGVPELRKLRQLEEQNQKLKQLVAEWSATTVEPG